MTNYLEPAERRTSRTVCRAPDEMEKAGFGGVTMALQHLRFAQDRQILPDAAGRRHTCAQLSAISDAAYETGVNRLVQELAASEGLLSRETIFAF